ncbi:MAG: hypothetical protein K2N95_06940 [Lachnospiraceae bacterium]|nr:hypothetical protein [Lachnospiraceae bacterium]
MRVIMVESPVDIVLFTAVSGSAIQRKSGFPEQRIWQNTRSICSISGSPASGCCLVCLSVGKAACNDILV